MLVDMLNGKVIIIVMMKTTMLAANTMVVTAVVMMSRRITAQLVNVLIQQNNALVHVAVLTGKVIIGVMMKTTIVDVNGMEEIVVVVM